MAGELTTTGLRRGLGIVDAGGGYVAEARALFARADNQPSAQVKRAANNLIVGLKGLNAWDGLDVLVLPLAEADAQSHKLNWRQAVYDLTAVNSPVCASYAWTGDAAIDGSGTSYLDTGLPANAAAGFQRNSHFLGVVCLAGGSNNNWLDAGASNTYINSLNGSGNMVVRSSFGGAGGAQAQNFGGTERGFLYLNRINSTTFQMGKDANTPIDKSTATDALNTETFKVLRSGSSYSGRAISGIVIGASLASSSICLELSSLIHIYYLDAFGIDL